MKVLWIYAHPEPRSLSGALRDEALQALTELGHEYRESDLYAMGWNPVVDAADFGHDRRERLLVAAASRQAYDAAELSPDILAEQRKLEWADTVVVQFPLWWDGMPAILKGWFDRVFVEGYAYGVRPPGGGRPLRYGNGGLAGKRALVVTTVGAPGWTIGPRGIHGDIDQLLFPLQRGTLFYTGMQVVPPFVVAGANRVSADDYATTAKCLRERLAELPATEPIPFRHQDSGDYDGDLILRPEFAAGEEGLGLHYSRRYITCSPT